MILFTKMYCFFASLHRTLYVSGFKKSIKIKKTVLSVGNLTFGGTGKTPFVLKLVENLQSLGLKPAIITRNYKATSLTSTLMNTETAAHPEIWGDEACWYFKKLSVPVYSGPRKWELAVLADKNPEVDVVIIDDGFQHHQLHKDINIVLVDAVAGIPGLKKRARESIATLKFADAVVMTRANLVTPEKLAELKAVLPVGKTLFLNQTLVKSLRNFQGHHVQMIGNRAGLVSGIANPQSFKNIFEQSFPNYKVMTLEFDDHHIYTENDLKEIEKFKVDNNLDIIVTTEKDEVKLKALNSDLFKVLQIETRFERDKEWITHLRGLIP